VKITILGNFRADYSSESHHKKSLESLGHEVVALQETEATSREILDAALTSQLFVWIHTHGWNTPGIPHMQAVLRTLATRGIPTMSYHLDLWFGLNRQRQLTREPVYKDIQHFFTVDRKMADWFNSYTRVKGHYLPAGVFHEECYIDDDYLQEGTVIFVGSKTYHREWPYRTQLINMLENYYGDNFTRYNSDTPAGLARGKRLNEVYSRAGVVVGDTLCIGFNYPDYWSDRIYETLGRGGFLIHPYVPGIEREFEDGVDCVFYEYKNFDQLRHQIDYYLQNPSKADEIRRHGHEKVKNNYTYRHRWQTILKELGLDVGTIS